MHIHLPTHLHDLLNLQLSHDLALLVQRSGKLVQCDVAALVLVNVKEHLPHATDLVHGQVDGNDLVCGRFRSMSSRLTERL